MKTLQIDSAHVKGEPGTGYEGPEGGPFECANCEYFNGRSCGQEDMLRRSKLPRDRENRPITDPHGCCEYVDRKENRDMAMTEAQKKAVPKSERGVPSKSGTGSYPMQTRKERGEAVALAAMHHGSNSAFTERIRAKANRLNGGSAKRIRDKARKIVGVR